MIGDKSRLILFIVLLLGIITSCASQKKVHYCGDRFDVNYCLYLKDDSFVLSSNLKLKSDIGRGIWTGALGGIAGSTAGLANVHGVIPGALYGGATGGLISGGLSAATGGSFQEGFTSGAIGGALTGGVSGGIAAAHSSHDRNILTGYIKREYLENFANKFYNQNFSSELSGMTNRPRIKVKALSGLYGKTDNLSNTVSATGQRGANTLITLNRSIVKQALKGSTNQLYLTAGHELQHAIHHDSGRIRSAFRNAASIGISPENRVGFVNTYSEIKAYQWSLNAAKRLSFRFDYYSNKLNYYNDNLYKFY
ncbi:MAG: hypothetical protein AAF620_19140 [Bacteroidota bacterium]